MKTIKATILLATKDGPPARVGSTPNCRLDSPQVRTPCLHGGGLDYGLEIVSEGIPTNLQG